MLSHLGTAESCDLLGCDMPQDGRWHHKFHQSWLKTTDICLERARREHADEMERWETDAANIGTAVHAAIETCLYEYHDGLALSEGSTLEVFQDAFSDLMLSVDWKWIKYTEKSARKFGAICTTGWYRQVLPTLPPEGQMELRFTVPFHEDDQRIIQLAGVIDYFDTLLRDWKTSSRGEYLEWEYKRWAVQPTVYTYAAHHLGLVEMEDSGVPFEYVVMHRKGVQRLTVYRGPEHWEFLRDKSRNVALLIEADIPAWPLNDNQALCSEKWCPAWADCKGKYGIEF